MKLELVWRKDELADETSLYFMYIVSTHFSNVFKCNIKLFLSDLMEGLPCLFYDILDLLILS